MFSVLWEMLSIAESIPERYHQYTETNVRGSPADQIILVPAAWEKLQRGVESILSAEIRLT